MALSDSKCRNVQAGSKLKKLSDGGGLQLWVPPTGGRLWRFAYRFEGKQRLLAIGGYPLVSLVKARQERDEAKQLLMVGLDPSVEKMRKKVEQQEKSNSFKVIAQEYIDKLKLEGRAEATITKTEWLFSFAYPTLGDLNVRDITAPAILEVLRRIEARKRYETARKLRSTIGAVFRYAIATARAETDPTYALREALVRPITKHRAAIIEPKALAGLLRSIHGFEGHLVIQNALLLMALLFPRPGELRCAEWTEFDLENAIWSIPGHRTKMRRPHRSPLSFQAIAILDHLKKISGNSKLLFPSIRSNDYPISDNTMNATLRRLGYTQDEMTAHGFRATASTLLNESGKWNADAIERQLAHVEVNSVRRAYARSEHWEERKHMMQWWADYLDGLVNNNIAARSQKSFEGSHAPLLQKVS